MRKISKYLLVTIERVEERIAEGWEPFNSPVLTELGTCQAMVKYEESPAEETIAHAVDRPVRLTIFPSGAEELSVFLTPGREPIQFIRSSHTDKWEQQ